MIPKSNTQEYKPITNKELTAKLLRAANKIARNSLYGGANMVYASSKMIKLSKNLKEKTAFYNKLKSIYRSKKLNHILSNL